VNRRNTVADAFGAEEIDGFADFLRPPTSPALREAVQPDFRRLLVSGRNASVGMLSSSPPMRMPRFPLSRSFGRTRPLHSSVGSELTRRVEDPTEAQAAVFEGFVARRIASKLASGCCFRQVHHADGRERYLGVDNILRQQVFTKIAATRA